MKNYWKLLSSEILLLIITIFGFIKSPILGTIILCIDLILNGVYWSIIISFKRYVETHNNEVKNTLEKDKEKYEELTLEQSVQLYKKGFVDRGKDKQPMFVKSIYEKKTKKIMPNAKI
jgi:hypothetical protein